jgi:hypothetical protein
MSSSRLRLGAAAAVVALGGVLFTAGAAQATEGATITVQSEDGAVFADEPLVASGTCPVKPESSATVTVEQGGSELTTEAVDVAADGTWSAKLDITDADTDDATVTVDCFAYGTEGPIASASDDVFVLPTNLPFIDVTATPSKVRQGGQLTITGTCPAGTETAAVAAGAEEADEPFFDTAVEPAADGSVSYTGTVPRDAETGDAIAYVLCGVGSMDALFDLDSDVFPTAVGFDEFTVLPAQQVVPVSKPAPAKPAAAAQPTLANTGSDNGPMTALAAGLLVLGAAAHVARRVTR